MKRKYAVYISIDSRGSILVEAESEKDAEKKAYEAIADSAPSMRRGLKGLAFNQSTTFYDVIEVDGRKVAVDRLEECFLTKAS